ncbi:MAG: PAS domain-containing protein [Sulfurimonadaceae bacterium]|jgi:PAS domain S-box-containing protein|nr:PAS domain-containing protein [Sulfurimonadaceae bacterium]
MAGKELTFNKDTFIVSKTDTKGFITYGNELFITMSGYSEVELLARPHNILRHPEMPAVIFEYLWKNITKKQEVFAYVINKTKNNDYYWVFAYVTASIDANDKIIGYHSVRRKPKKSSLDIIKPLYKELLSIEKTKGIEASRQKLIDILKEKKVSYEEFILSF